MKIAVIGSGISGLGAAHFLSKKHKVDVFEKENHFGGHSYTVEIPINNSNNLISLDLGFIVFNKINYPNLVKFFSTLRVPYEKSNMSFSVFIITLHSSPLSSYLRDLLLRCGRAFFPELLCTVLLPESFRGSCSFGANYNYIGLSRINTYVI